MNDQKVIFLTPFENTFEGNYLAVRAKENRVYSDKFVKNLPSVPSAHRQFKEWHLRQKTTERFLGYLKKGKYQNVLDIGCGNGWFSNKIAENVSGKVLGLDVNLQELEQGRSVFQNNKLSFAYGDIFQAEFKQPFDLIVLNASIQYFPDLELLFNRLKSLLSDSGEIHILDSPFYPTERECLAAKERTESYYSQLGFPEMSDFYFHHLQSNLKGFKQLYFPKTNLVQKLLKRKDSPFGWFVWSQR